MYSSLHPLDWLRNGGAHSIQYPYHTDIASISGAGAGPDETADVLRTDRPCKLVQSPGEVLFVPRHWTHQVIIIYFYNNVVMHGKN